MRGIEHASVLVTKLAGLAKPVHRPFRNERTLTAHARPLSLGLLDSGDFFPDVIPIAVQHAPYFRPVVTLLIQFLDLGNVLIGPFAMRVETGFALRYHGAFLSFFLATSALTAALSDCNAAVPRFFAICS
jgi:hypothetical protein